ncbi:MAG: 7TM diverse intracellular signaling domain-containing protein [Cytophagaceae bacterium]
MSRIVLLLFLLNTGLLCRAGDVLQLGNTEDYLLDQKLLEYYIDNTESKSIEEISQYSFEKFSEEGKPPYIKHPGSTYWLRFSISRDSNDNRRWILENLDAHIDEFDLYMKSGDTYEVLKAGYASDFDLRPFPHKNFVFEIPLHEGVNTFYIRTKSRIHNPLFIKVRTSGYFTQYALKEYYLLGLFYGILIIMAIYNLLLYVAAKEKIYIYYFLYILVCIGITLVEDGIGFQYLWSDFPAINTFISSFFPLLLVVSFYVYSVNFLDLKQTDPFFHKLLKWLIPVYAGFFFLKIVFSDFYRDLPYYIIPFVFIYIASVRVLIKGFRPARFFILAYSFVLVSIVILILRMAGITHWSNLFTIYSFNIGLVFEAVILTLAHADKFRILKEEKELEQRKRAEAQDEVIYHLRENEKLKDKVNRELEEKVRERTLELERQNKIIQELNSVLKSQNIQLKDDVKEISTSRVVQKAVSYEEFLQIYPSEESCLKYLADLKWKQGYKCRKCSYEQWSKGKTDHSRRCNKCGYDESPTVNTLFHRVKFPIEKAFYIAYLVSSGKNFSIDQISFKMELRRQTCLEFKRKAEEIMRGKKAPKDPEQDWAYLLLESPE